MAFDPNVDIELPGSRRKLKLKLADGNIQGPLHICEQRIDRPADVNLDGKLDCLDLQVMGRQLGALPSQELPDQNANGAIDAGDLLVLKDRIIGRPVIIAQRLQGPANGLMKIAGIDLGNADQEVTVKLGEAELEIVASFDREKLVRLPGNDGRLEAQSLTITIDGQATRAVKFEFE